MLFNLNYKMTEIEKAEDISSLSKLNLVYLDKLTFDNVYGELDYYKKKCEILEKDLFKSQTQIKKLEDLIQMLITFYKTAILSF